MKRKLFILTGLLLFVILLIFLLHFNYKKIDSNGINSDKYKLDLSQTLSAMSNIINGKMIKNLNKVLPDSIDIIGKKTI